MKRLLSSTRHGVYATLAALLAGCSGGTSGPGPAPIGAPLPAARTSAQPDALLASPNNSKGPGTFGVAVGDMLAVEWNSAVVQTCSTPITPTNDVCNGPIPKASFPKDQLTESGSNQGATDSASLLARTAVGRLSGNVAAAAAPGVQNGVVVAAAAATATVNLSWTDTVTFTPSASLPVGSPVTFTATLAFTGKPKFACTALSGGSVEAGIGGIASLYALDECTGTTLDIVPPVLSAQFTTTVGTSIPINGFLQLSASADTSFVNGGSTSSGTFGAKFHLDPVTAGATYATASGKSFLTPAQKTATEDD